MFAFLSSVTGEQASAFISMQDSLAINLYQVILDPPVFKKHSVLGYSAIFLVLVKL